MLALEERVVTHNVRISVVHEDMRTWRLRIKQLRESDRGCYMCQINASPMRKQIGCIDVQGELTVPAAISVLADKSFGRSGVDRKRESSRELIEVLLDKHKRIQAGQCTVEALGV